ncbi:rRNA-processing protein UTP23 homolog [Amia ocellicauda]|uniref:rRNA-processing protein UTP23 homolog n=1 Tax=Amia ocellicauda TaxID=2972642 RepID=UPI003463AEF1|nr:UTP23 protein [Amia calva]
MKVKRQKQAKKTISFYKYNFSFREPFQILLDGTFCQAALKNKIQIKEQMPKYLMGEVQLCTTNCVLKELESLGKELYGAKIILQRFQIRNCQHFKDPIPASQCLKSMLGENNPHHYFIATQDQALTAAVKKINGVPLLFIIQNTIVLDKPSLQSVAYVQAIQAGQVVTTQEQKSIQTLKEEQGLVKNMERKGKKRKRKGPNPLSCLKKKKLQSPSEKTADVKKRKRSRHRKHNATGLLTLQTAAPSGTD